MINNLANIWKDSSLQVNFFSSMLWYRFGLAVVVAAATTTAAGAAAAASLLLGSLALPCGSGWLLRPVRSTSTAEGFLATQTKAALFFL